MDDSPTNTDFPSLPVGTPEENLKLASDLAAINLLFVQQEVSRRILEPSLTSKMLLDFGEHSFKVSGMQKKQDRSENGGVGFSIVINFPDGPAQRVEKVVTPEPPPETFRSLLCEGAELVDFSLAPEFTSANT